MVLFFKRKAIVYYNFIAGIISSANYNTVTLYSDVTVEVLEGGAISKNRSDIRAVRLSDQL